MLSLTFTLIAMIVLIITILSSFWMYGDTNTRYGLWFECKIIESVNNSITTSNNNNNNNLKCKLMNKGKQKFKMQNLHLSYLK